MLMVSVYILPVQITINLPVFFPDREDPAACIPHVPGGISPDHEQVGRQMVTAVIISVFTGTLIAGYRPVLEMLLIGILFFRQLCLELQGPAVVWRQLQT
jgi:hypothetical protein